ncbi:MAG: PQQ-binding-like beta-propeller repeat protein, partial [Verrucomicrobiales bacterium]
YEGSSSGSSFPRFSWIWQEPGAGKSAAVNQTTPVTTGVSLSPDAPGATLVNFLGPDRDGMEDGLPFGTDWATHPPELVWRRPIGKAWSSFAVIGTKAITQQQVGDDELVTCIDLATGRDLWNHTDRNTRLLLERAENSGGAMGGDGPRATPTIHEGKVYTMGGTGRINCLDLESGKALWSRHLIKDLGGVAQRWGMASAPLILPSPKCVVFAGPDVPGPTLIACDLATGKDVWIYEGSGASYNSARLLTLFGVEQIVTVNATDVSGLDPSTGTELWKYPWPGFFPKVAQPLVYNGDKLLVTASYGVGSLLLQLSDKSGKIEVTQLWKTTAMKTKFSSAAIIADHAYGLDEGRFACIDLKTGKRVWKNQKFGFGQHLLFGDCLLVQAESGNVIIGTTSPEGFVEKGRIPALTSMTWNVPTVAGRILLVRNDLEAACYLLPPKS